MAQDFSFGIVADDLTGACDTGIKFSKGNRAVAVTHRLGSIVLQSSLVLAVSTNSRNDELSTVFARTVDACAAMEASGRCVSYVKIDSALRGYPGAQIGATLQATGRSSAIISPALPSHGRRLVAGRLESDSCAEHKNMHLPTALEDQGLHSVLHIGQKCVRGGGSNLLRRLQDALQGAVQAIVIDASCDEDLKNIVAVCQCLQPMPLLVGSAGLAGQVAAFHEPQGHEMRNKVPSMPRSNGSCVFFVGSDHPTTVEQLDRFISERDPVMTDTDSRDLRSVESGLQSGEDLVIRILWHKPEEALTEIIGSDHWPGITGVFACGGDTAQLVCDVLDVQAINLKGEILPGVPWGVLMGGIADGCHISMKSGGFGDELTLERVRQFFYGQPSCRV